MCAGAFQQHGYPWPAAWLMTSPICWHPSRRRVYLELWVDGEKRYKIAPRCWPAGQKTTATG